jgi:hypothetical protein
MFAFKVFTIFVGSSCKHYGPVDSLLPDLVVLQLVVKTLRSRGKISKRGNKRSKELQIHGRRRRGVNEPPFRIVNKDTFGCKR